jgi:hypothetical protein
MTDYAGYAAAVTIRAQVFNDVALVAWQAGQIQHTINQSYGQLPEQAGVNFFLQYPQAILSSDDPSHLILRLNGSGNMSRRTTPIGRPESQPVQWQADLQIPPQGAFTGPLLLISAQSNTYQLAAWQFDVLGGTPFSAPAEALFNSDGFKSALLGWLSDAVGNLEVPIPLGALGPFSTNSFTYVALKAVNGALLLGLDMDSTANNDPFSTSGNISQLGDTAGTNNVELVINPDAIGPLMPDAYQNVQAQLADYDATLDTLAISCEEGKFRIKGSAHRTGGAANFSLGAAPLMGAELPGSVVPVTQKKELTVRPRTWRALSFVPVDVSVDVDQSEWVKVLDVVLGTITLGFVAFADWAFVSGIERNITGQIETAELNPSGATPLVFRIALFTGSPLMRIGVEQFDIHSDGVYVGVSTKLEAPAAKLSGVQSIPSNYINQNIPYSLRLPFDAMEDDPSLRVRWTVIDLGSGNILLNQDDVAKNRLSFSFIPSSVGPGLTRFAVVCRAYRALGPFMTEVLNQTIRLTVGPPLGQGVFVAWNYGGGVPQIIFNDSTMLWGCLGYREVKRRSTIHRVDKPCKNANHRSRFSPTVQFFDDLPFPISEIFAQRTRLCDYCFFGGPGSTIASL